MPINMLVEPKLKTLLELVKTSTREELVWMNGYLAGLLERPVRSSFYRGCGSTAGEYHSTAIAGASCRTGKTCRAEDHAGLWHRNR